MHSRYDHLAKYHQVQINLKKQYLLSEVLSISIVFHTVHEVGRESKEYLLSVLFSACTVHEVGREQGVLTISVVFCMYCT